MPAQRNIKRTSRSSKTDMTSSPYLNCILIPSCEANKPNSQVKKVGKRNFNSVGSSSPSHCSVVEPSSPSFEGESLINSCRDLSSQSASPPCQKTIKSRPCTSYDLFRAGSRQILRGKPPPLEYPLQTSRHLYDFASFALELPSPKLKKKRPQRPENELRSWALEAATIRTISNSPANHHQSLVQWMVFNEITPYPSRQWREIIACVIRRTPDQVNNWFANTREDKSVPLGYCITTSTGSDSRKNLFLRPVALEYSAIWSDSLFEQVVLMYNFLIHQQP